MTRTIFTKQRHITALAALILGLAFLAAAPQNVHSKTVEDLYPLLSDRFIKSADLVALEDDLILQTHTGIMLTQTRGIQSIPVQAFFDATGKEVFRHTGFYPEEAVMTQLKKIGVAQ